MIHLNRSKYRELVYKYKLYLPTYLLTYLLTCLVDYLQYVEMAPKSQRQRIMLVKVPTKFIQNSSPLKLSPLPPPQ